MSPEGPDEPQTTTEHVRRLDVKHVRVLLIEHGWTVSKIAKELNIGKGTVSNVLSGRRIAFRLRGRIAELIGLSVRELFQDIEVDE